LSSREKESDVSKLRSFAWVALSALSLAAGTSVVSCTSSDDVDNTTPDGSSGSAGTGGSTGGAGGSTGGTGGSTGGAGGSTGGAGGTGGSAQPACASKVTVQATDTLITNFETIELSGTTGDTTTYTFAGGVLGGTYAYVDALSTKTVSLVPGFDTASTKAFSVEMHARSLFPDGGESADAGSSWGGGLGLWLGCVDASGHAGIRFWAKGSVPSSTPVNTVKVLLTNADTLEAPAGTCTAAPCTRPEVNIELTADWTEHTLAWADFTAGVAGTTPVPATGNNLTGIEFAVSNNNEPNEISVVIDDVAFMPLAP
jgi:hypothetical protein